uniref:Charged multivesicular body protein 6 n=1 Tax=Hanusia phi TaxID=3032 RepID=A0A7S0HV97_9CRYP
MGNLLAKKKKNPKISQADMAILELKGQRDKLLQHQKQIQTAIEQAQKVAATLIKEKKEDRALLALKKKTLHTRRLTKVLDQVLHMEELISGVETAQRDKEIFLAMKKGTETLKEIRQELSMESVESLMNDSAEAVETQNRISEMLAGNFDKEEEEAMNRELDLMMGEAGVPADRLELPSVPSKEPTLLEQQGVGEEEEEDMPLPPPAEAVPA